MKIEQQATEAIAWIKNSPCASGWIKRAMGELDNRDILDALKDVELLAMILKNKFNEISGVCHER